MEKKKTAASHQQVKVKEARKQLKGKYTRTKKRRGGGACFGLSPADSASRVVYRECLEHGYLLTDVILGEGSYAKVKLAETQPNCGRLKERLQQNSSFKSAGFLVAIKVIEKKLLRTEFLRKFLPREVFNHFYLPGHPNIAKLYDHFTTPSYVYLVLEYCNGGDLLEGINDHLSCQKQGVNEEMARNIFRQICWGLKHCHHHGVIHRDLKCENILLDKRHNAKITDFGFSVNYKRSRFPLQTSCGSYAYTAPEVIMGKNYDGARADIWSLGIILFATVNGRLPFDDSNLKQMEEDIKVQRLKFEKNLPVGHQSSESHLPPRSFSLPESKNPSKTTELSAVNTGLCQIHPLTVSFCLHAKSLTEHCSLQVRRPVVGKSKPRFDILSLTRAEKTKEQNKKESLISRLKLQPVSPCSGSTPLIQNPSLGKNEHTRIYAWKKESNGNARKKSKDHKSCSTINQPSTPF